MGPLAACIVDTDAKRIDARLTQELIIVYSLDNCPLYGQKSKPRSQFDAFHR